METLRLTSIQSFFWAEPCSTCPLSWAAVPVLVSADASCADTPTPHYVGAADPSPTHRAGTAVVSCSCPLHPLAPTGSPSHRHLRLSLQWAEKLTNWTWGNLLPAATSCGEREGIWPSCCPLADRVPFSIPKDDATMGWINDHSRLWAVHKLLQ